MELLCQASAILRVETSSDLVLAHTNANVHRLRFAHRGGECGLLSCQRRADDLRQRRNRAARRAQLHPVGCDVFNFLAAESTGYFGAISNSMLTRAR